MKATLVATQKQHRAELAAWIMGPGIAAMHIDQQITGLDYATSMVQYNQLRVNRLTSYIKDEMS